MNHCHLQVKAQKRVDRVAVRTKERLTGGATSTVDSMKHLSPIANNTVRCASYLVLYRTMRKWIHLVKHEAGDATDD